MRYHIWTAGCQMNVADSQRVASALEKLGYLPSPRAEDADVIVLNTCVVRQSAEDKAYGWLHTLRPLKARRPEVVINLMGCLVGIKGNPELRTAFPFVDVFSPPSDLGPLIEHLLMLAVGSPDLLEIQHHHTLMDGDWVLPQSERGRLVSAYVPVIEGCSHACSFCVIPLRRGVEHSRPMDEVTSEVRCLAKQGVREVTLLGQIVDRYGKDLPDRPTLADLLREVHEIEEIDRIRFLTSHPNWLTDELIEAVAELPKVCEHIEVPVQAGDDEILRRMKRGYSTEDYRLLIKQIRQRVPETSLATDIIIGFPGETTIQFRRTYQLLEELRFDVVHLARYSPRPGTVAARRMEDDLPQEEKMHRFRVLEELQAQIAGEINTGYVGRTVNVLVDEMHKDRWKGRTRTNKLVFFKSDDNLRGQTVPVRIEWAGPWSMRGVPAMSVQTQSTTPIVTTV
ncbi:MAG: tRNA (N6-isopentenyl adenosine(37)-C2)-methylthiotransferase MiaB [Chloroflexi bacterium]|nr:MAG: tRNA (N6-isopentenyl adenosine(37)-C2)-methylthiotransferase MiaB [Chloroflexota bacterium]